MHQAYDRVVARDPIWNLTGNNHFHLGSKGEGGDSILIAAKMKIHDLPRLDRNCRRRKKSIKTAEYLGEYRVELINDRPPHRESQVADFLIFDLKRNV